MPRVPAKFMVRHITKRLIEKSNEVAASVRRLRIGPFGSVDLFCFAIDNGRKRLLISPTEGKKSSIDDHPIGSKCAVSVQHLPRLSIPSDRSRSCPDRFRNPFDLEKIRCKTFGHLYGGNIKTRRWRSGEIDKTGGGGAVESVTLLVEINPTRSLTLWILQDLAYRRPPCLACVRMGTNEDDRDVRLRPVSDIIRVADKVKGSAVLTGKSLASLTLDGYRPVEGASPLSVDKLNLAVDPVIDTPRVPNEPHYGHSCPDEGDSSLTALRLLRVSLRHSNSQIESATRLSHPKTERSLEIERTTNVPANGGSARIGRTRGTCWHARNPLHCAHLPEMLEYPTSASSPHIRSDAWLEMTQIDE